MRKTPPGCEGKRTTPHGMRFGGAVFFHPDYDRRLRHRTGSADLPATILVDAAEALAGSWAPRGYSHWVPPTAGGELHPALKTSVWVCRQASGRILAKEVEEIRRTSLSLALLCPSFIAEPAWLHARHRDGWQPPSTTFWPHPKVHDGLAPSPGRYVPILPANDELRPHECTYIGTIFLWRNSARCLELH